MIRTQISFDRSLYERAKRIARRQGVSLAELCRRSLAEAVARNDSSAGRPWMRHVGVIEGGAGDSTTVDEVVYGRERP
ncbi:MAG TPA: CopG family transcriptional regulator [Rhizomicrobium sp.]|nr:CopG family transcriptional regulator [Rhizomicrobium sp.]